jgi:glyoxylase-like metal-dependent hydrolase (beta-lactamase superfamily II)
MSRILCLFRGTAPALLALGVAAGLPSLARADGPAEVAAAPADRHPDLKRLSPTAEIWVDPTRKEVVVGGAIALDRGMIEVFACPKHTKEHEAIVATSAPARLVHAALLAIGLEPGRPVSFDPDYRVAQGPAVEVLVRWRDAEGRPQQRRAQELVRSTSTRAALDADWVFAGSAFWKDPTDGQEYYQADGGDLICVSNFPTATLDLPIESSQANDALLFEVFEDRVPPRGTEVELVLSAKR